ncbi:MAG: hypothetical protein HYV52_03005, partial [Parcubacteria group bacterium]|nr:hypothetical protein [Parcubacteria group bacterium]
APPPGAYFPLGYTDWLTPPGPVIFGQLEYWGGLIKAIDPFSDFLFYDIQLPDGKTFQDLKGIQFIGWSNKFGDWNRIEIPPIYTDFTVR